MENLGINPVQILAQIVNFGILLFVLNKFLYKPALKALRTRRSTIEESLKKAEEIAEKEVLMHKEMQAHEKSTLLAAHKLKQTTTREAEQEAKTILKNAQKDAEKIKSEAQKEAEAYLSHAHKKHDEELALEAVKLSRNAISKFVSEKSQKEITKQKIKQFLQKSTS